MKYLFSISNYINKNYRQFIKAYTDASNSEQNRVRIAMVVTGLLNKIINDYIKVCTGKMLAFMWCWTGFYS